MSGGEDGYIRVLDIHTGMELFARDLGAGVGCLYWDPASLLAGTRTGALLVCDLLNDRLLSSLQAHEGGLLVFPFFPIPL